MLTTNSKFLKTTPNSLNVILIKFEDHWSDASHKMTQYENTESSAEHSAEYFRKS